MTAVNQFQLVGYPVFGPDTLRVHHGVNRGDGIHCAQQIALDDIYRLSHSGIPETLYLQDDDASDICLGAALTFMDNDGNLAEALIISHKTEHPTAEHSFILPLATFQPDTDYRLIHVEMDGAQKRFDDLSRAHFTAGTAITMANGATRPVQDLRFGDLIMTRDNGPQPVRWVGCTTMRANGAFAPIHIRAGALGNHSTLTIGPGMLIYTNAAIVAVQPLNMPRSNAFVAARDLVDDTLITQPQGGFVDYYQLIFDAPETLFAQGIAVTTDPNAKAQETRPASIGNNALAVKT